MMERLVLNRCVIFNVLADRIITSQSMAQKLEIKEHEWLFFEPLLKQIIEKHLMQYHENRDTIIQTFKQTLASEIKRLFSPEWDSTESDVLKSRFNTFGQTLSIITSWIKEASKSFYR
ncbi:Hypothetical protein CINCED_3A020552 [Cinara cedri]|uniref:Uncharacterized protein n=1 Tax=Cinara cedri TaxID=506608 RepID=A0A5E4MK94_9HEMI|nr:Hypothetical protein CINCED_3A020552 [Cinara cedri]